MSAPEPPTSLPESEVVFYPILSKVEDHPASTMGFGSTKVLGGSMVSNPDTVLVHKIKAHASSQSTGGESRLDDIYTSWASQVLKTGRTMYEALDRRLLLALAATVAAEKPFNAINCTSMEKVWSHLSTLRSATSSGLPSQEEITQRYLSGSATSDEVNLIPPSCFAKHNCRLATDVELDAYISERWSIFEGSGLCPLVSSDIRGA